MLSPKIAKTLLVTEIRGLLLVKALWVMLLILSFLTGYSFIQAVDLFSQASRTAIRFPEMARGMTPFDGVIVPTFGALYLVTTLLFPFVAIRLVSTDKQSGSLKLLVQSQPMISDLVALKTVSLAIGWLLALTPTLLSLALWSRLGGHLYAPEILNLLWGYTLYALIIAGVSFLAAALTTSTSTAAILALAVTLGSWVLDFAAGTQGWLHHFSPLSLTAFLQSFEHGLFSLAKSFQALLVSLGFFALTVLWLHPGRHLPHKLWYSLLILTLTVTSVTVSSDIRVFYDVTENRRNSFNPADERSLAMMTKPLTITVYMTQEDSRLYDYKRSVLDILQRILPDIHIVYPYASSSISLGAIHDEKYGLITYDYDGKHDESRSNSPREILPILHQLAGRNVVPDSLPDYPGYPLVTDSGPSNILFYLLLPLFFVVLCCASHRFPKWKKGY